MNKELIWYGPTWSYSGYATHNRYMVLGLEKLGWKIQLVPTERNIPEVLRDKERLLRMWGKADLDPLNCVCVNLVPPPPLPLYGKYTVLYTTLESKTVHEGFLRRCMMFNEVWVPCKENYKSMVNAGWPRKKLFYVPEGVDTEYYTPQCGVLPGIRKDVFTFLFVGDWSYRKGVQWLIPAFAKAFRPGDNVRLLISSHYQGEGDEKARARIKTEYRELLGRYKIRNGVAVEFLYDWIPDNLLPKFYNSVDCVVLLSCGEAWGLPLIQAMSCGKPVMATAWGGQTDFVNEKNGYLVKVDKFDTIHDKVNLGVDFYWYQKFAFPSIDEASKLFRYIYEHQGEARQKGIRGRKDVCEKFSWGKAVEVADKRLTKICRRLT